MYSGVVEFDTLPDTDGAGAKHDNLLLITDTRIVFLLIGGVEVGDVAAAAACFNHFINGEQVHFLSQIINCNLILLPQLCDILVGKAHFLCRCQNFLIADIFCQSGFVIDNLLEGFQEIFRNHGCLEDFMQRNAIANQLCDGINAVIGACCNIAQHILVGHGIEFRHIQMANADFQGTNGFQQTFLQCTSDTHNLAGCLHLCGKRICGSCKFIEGEAGHFCYDIIQCRLVVCGCFAQLDFIQCHADSNFCGNSCDGVAACLGCQCRGTGNAGVYLD